MIPPEEKRARKVYDSIVTKINENKEYACKDIFDRFCRPPYGMSEDVIHRRIKILSDTLNCLVKMKLTRKNIQICFSAIVGLSQR